MKSGSGIPQDKAKDCSGKTRQEATGRTFIRTMTRKNPGRARRIKRKLLGQEGFGCCGGQKRNSDRPIFTPPRSEEHTSELQSRENLVCRLLLEKKNRKNQTTINHQ